MSRTTTPHPLHGLDGEIYQPGTVDYHAGMTELRFHGFTSEAIGTSGTFSKDFLPSKERVSGIRTTGMLAEA
jgi:hypothetical protein